MGELAALLALFAGLIGLIEKWPTLMDFFRRKSQHNNQLPELPTRPPEPPEARVYATQTPYELWGLVNGKTKLVAELDTQHYVGL